MILKSTILTSIILFFNFMLPASSFIPPHLPHLTRPNYLFEFYLLTPYLRIFYLLTTLPPYLQPSYHTTAASSTSFLQYSNILIFYLSPYTSYNISLYLITFNLLTSYLTIFYIHTSNLLTSLYPTSYHITF